MIAESQCPPDRPPSSDARALKWAAEQLAVPPDSPPEACTAAFLRRLAEEDFVPPRGLSRAWEFAARRSPEAGPAMPWLDGADEAELAGQVEAFAGRFFDLAPEERSRSWEALYADAQRWPRLEAGLRQLKPGLAVEFKPLAALSLREAKLIEWIRELFPLPLEERAARRRRMLRDGPDREIRPWQKAAQRVQRRQRAIAALAPDLLVPLATWSKRVKDMSRNRHRHVTVSRTRLWRGALRGIFSARPGIWTAVVVSILASNLIRSLQTEPRYSPGNYSPPTTITQPSPLENPDFVKLLRELNEKQQPAPNPSPLPSNPSPPLVPLGPSDSRNLDGTPLVPGAGSFFPTTPKNVPDPLIHQ